MLGLIIFNPKAGGSMPYKAGDMVVVEVLAGVCTRS